MALLQRFKTSFAEPAPEPAPAAAAGPRSAGDALRQRRESLGLELAQCARALNIKPAFLAALEEGRPDQLPGAAYAIGFVRAYGDYLGLDSRELLRRFKAGSAALDTRQDLTFPMPLGERGVPGGGMLLVALILAICGYGTWYYWSTAQRAHPQRVGEVPLALLGPKPKPPVHTDTAAAKPAAPGPAAAMPQSPPAQPQPASGPAAAPAPTPAAVEPPPAAPSAPTAAAAAPSPTPAVPPAAPLVSGLPAAAPRSAAASPPPAPHAAAPTAAAASGHSYGDVDGKVRIVIRATADSWIQVTDSDQGTLFTRTLKAGDSYRVPDRPGLSLRTGNAGGLDIEVDGHPAPSIGKSGMLRRDVALEPLALTAGSAVHD
jgi:cytoskeleton protein RodZ